jgi:hypothetical protein
MRLTSETPRELIVESSFKENSMQSRCRYTRINGARCTMPTLNGHELCYQHEERRRLAALKWRALPEPNAAGPLVSFCYVEDHASILANLNAIAEAFANHQIDYRQASMLNHLMQTGLKTLRQMNVIENRIDAEEVVRDITYDDSGHPLAADPALRSKVLRKLTAAAIAPRRKPPSNFFSNT